MSCRISKRQLNTRLIAHELVLNYILFVCTASEAEIHKRLRGWLRGIDFRYISHIQVTWLECRSSRLMPLPWKMLNGVCSSSRDNEYAEKSKPLAYFYRFTWTNWDSTRRNPSKSMRETTFGNLLVVFVAQPHRRKRVPTRWALCLSLSPIQWVRATIAAKHSSAPCCFPSDSCAEKIYVFYVTIILYQMPKYLHLFIYRISNIAILHIYFKRNINTNTHKILLNVEILICVNYTVDFCNYNQN